MKLEKYRSSKNVEQTHNQANSGRTKYTGKFVVRAHDHANSWFEQPHVGE